MYRPRINVRTTLLTLLCHARESQWNMDPFDVPLSLIAARCIQNAKSLERRGHRTKAERLRFMPTGALAPVGGMALAIGHAVGPDNFGGVLTYLCHQQDRWVPIHAGRPLPKCACGKRMLLRIEMPEPARDSAPAVVASPPQLSEVPSPAQSDRMQEWLDEWARGAGKNRPTPSRSPDPMVRALLDERVYGPRLKDTARSSRSHLTQHQQRELRALQYLATYGRV